MEQQVIGNEYKKWITKLMSYDFDIQYQSGASNKVGDALSRQPNEAECTSINGPNMAALGSFEN